MWSNIYNRKAYTFLLLLIMMAELMFAGDLRLTVMTGEAGNVEIRKGSGKLDKQHKCLVNASTGTIVYLGNINFGDGTVYSQISVESASEGFTGSQSSFEVYISDPSVDVSNPIAVIRPKQTDSGFWFRSFSGDIIQKVTGEKPVYILWKDHTSNLYAVNFQVTQSGEEGVLSDEAMMWPIYSPYVHVVDFKSTLGFVNERNGMINGDNRLVVDLGTIDFEDGLYDKIIIEAANGETVPEDASFDIYLDREDKAFVQPESYLTVNVSDKKSAIETSMYGIFFEDINRSVDGGIYAEMIFNRSFEDMNLPSSCTYNPVDKQVYAPHKPVYSNVGMYKDFAIPWNINDEYPGWSVDALSSTKYTVAIDESVPLAPTNVKSLRLNILEYTDCVKLLNTGFNGLAIKANEKYRLVFYLRAEDDYKGDVEAQILSNDESVLVTSSVKVIHNGEWNKYECVLIPGKTLNNGKFALSFLSSGSINIDYVSLFPVKTFMDRENGFRKDVAEFVAGLKPAFIRWPGGCIVEGLTMENRVKWKNTIGDPMKRIGEYNLWGYHSSNGFGYHEFLQFCEDIHAKGVFVCNAGLSCDARNGDFYKEDELEPLIQEALDAIEYAIGDASTKWGAERAGNGRAEPFKLDYIEIGNENHSEIYAKYYNIFYKRIHEKYPDLKIITCLGVTDQLGWLTDFDMNDPHFYNNPNWFYQNTNYFDNIRREGYTTYVGEYACNMGVGRGNMDAALSEAAFMIGMERNSDLVTMTSYAPLIENPGYTASGVNMIHVKNDDVFGRSSYYVQKMFSESRPDVNVGISFQPGKLEESSFPAGYIGLASWNTSVEYKNIKVKVDGNVVYESDFINRPDEWEFISGDWKIENGKLMQTNVNGHYIAMLKTRKFASSDMSVEFEAVKKGGEEGFVFMFGCEDYRNNYQMTLGSYGNRWTIFEKVVNGTQATLNDDRPSMAVIPNKEYKVGLTIKDRQWDCSVNGISRLKYENRFIQKQYAIAGLNESTKELVIKVVNAEETPMSTTLNIQNALKLQPTGSVTTLSASSREDENSFTFPQKISPVYETLQNVNTRFQYTFKPLSLTILHLKIE